MKLKIKRTVLLEALNNASKAISTKNIIPILSGIKFDLFKDKLVITASDNDITIQTSISSGDDLIIEDTGSIVIKGKYILDIIRKLDSEFINIEIISFTYFFVHYIERSKIFKNVLTKNYGGVILCLASD